MSPAAADAALLAACRRPGVRWRDALRGKLPREELL
jgi:hypothetical protein